MIIQKATGNNQSVKIGTMFETNGAVFEVVEIHGSMNRIYTKKVEPIEGDPLFYRHTQSRVFSREELAHVNYIQ